jgi:hypothetical protein
VPFIWWISDASLTARDQLIVQERSQGFQGQLPRRARDGLGEGTTLQLVEQLVHALDVAWGMEDTAGKYTNQKPLQQHIEIE